MKKFVILQLFICFFCFNNSVIASNKAVEVDLFIKDHKFSPEVLELPSGKKIRITIYNQDSTIEEFESIDLKREKIILGKSKSVVILANLKPGTYEFFGEFHQDTAKGKIIVTEEEKEECSK